MNASLAEIPPPLACCAAMRIVILIVLAAACHQDAATPTATKATLEAQQQAIGGTRPTAGPAAQPTSQPVQGPKALGQARANPHGQPTGPAGDPTSQPVRTGTPPQGATPTSLPSGHPPIPSGGAAAAGPSGSVQGKISVSPKLAKSVKPGQTLFLIVRREAGNKGRGMMLAAKKVPVSGPKMFPYAYTVGPKDIMMPDVSLSGVVRVSARIDNDGDALSKAPGDLQGIAKQGVPLPAAGVDFILDEAI